MGIKTFERNLTLLGNARWEGGWRNYSVVEIGGVTIKGLVCNDELDTYLQLAQGKQIKLTVSRRSGFDTFIFGWFSSFLAWDYHGKLTAENSHMLKRIHLDGKQYPTSPK